MKRLITLAIATIFSSACLFAQNTIAENCSVVDPANEWIYSASKNVALKILPSRLLEQDFGKGKLIALVSKDTGEKVKVLTFAIASKGSQTIQQINLGKLEAGFYKVELSTIGKSRTYTINIGIDPENVVSTPDRQNDFTEFWDRARAELAQVEPDYKMELLSERSNEVGDVYRVTMNSLWGHRLQCFLAVPRREGRHPIIINYNGYGSTCWIPEPNAEFCVMTVSTRGQGTIEENIYGDWIRWNIDNPEKYYYRGAFMDCVRAIDFAAQCQWVDPDRMFAQGGSQGGAFTLAAASLDDRLCAVAPDVPFLGDYPDYFKIVSWPASAVREAQKEKGLSDEQLFRNLSYFDIKNLTPWIKCPVLMAFGLQDPVCPPHTNFSGFNNIPHANKHWKAYYLSGHDVWTQSDWDAIRWDFFKSITTN